MMLDDLKYIHEKDAQDALGIAEKQSEQLLYGYSVAGWTAPIRPPTNVVYAGMGGSSLAALVSRSWPGYSVPFEVCREYRVPAYLDDRTLFIACSYSGNTEETVAALEEAAQAQATIVVLAGGGRLLDIAKDRGYSYLVLPKAQQPRFAILYNLKALVSVLEWAGLVSKDQTDQLWQPAADFLSRAVKDWLPTVPTNKNPAKQLALDIVGKTPVIYGGPLMSPAAYKWRIGFNENAKNVAWWNELPEFNHNEMIGWTSHPVQKPYVIISLLSNLEHKRVQKRFEVTERLLSGMRPASHNIDLPGDTLMKQLLWAINFGDFVTLYLGLLNGLNPTPVELVERFKKALDD